MNSKYDYLRKKLLYQSNHRGCKETDLLLGKFASVYLNEMSYQELEAYDIVLSQTDADIVSWVMGHSPIPQDLESDIMTKLLNLSKI